MNGKQFLYLCLVLAILLSGILAPLAQPSVAFGATPNTPSNQLPLDNATGISLTPTLVASSFSDNDTLDTHVRSQWQIRLGTAGENNYTNPVFKSTTNDNSTNIAVPLGVLSYSTTYYWHVSYRDSTGAWSDNSSETSFTTMNNQPPDTPSNTSPADGTTVSLTPTLQSSAFNDPGDTQAASQWQITTVPGNYASSLVWDNVSLAPNLTSTAVPSGLLSYSTTYYWHVRHQDNNGAWSAFSAETSFTTSANQAPATPTTLSPREQTDVSVTPTLTSSPFNDPGDTHAASQWQIRTATGPGSSWGNPLFDSGTDNVNLTSIIIPSGNLGYSTLYLWRVRHLDNYKEWSAYSAETWFITSANRIPNQPVNSSPGNGDSGQSLTPTLVASAFSDPDAGDTQAASQWQITTTPGNYAVTVFDSGTDNVNLTSTVVPSGRLNYNTTYYWHVRYCDNNGAWSGFSSETSFTTSANQPPYPPTNSLPANLATGVSLTPTLQSSAFNDPGDTQAASQWQITTVPGNYASSLVWDNVSLAPNLTSTAVPSGLLSYSTTYYWHVRHQDSQQVWSAWSSLTSFTTRPSGTGADFVANVTALIVGQSVQFTDTSTGAIVSWTWDFGDGTAPVTWNTRPSDGRVSHMYSVAGTYTVGLTITDSADKSYTETKPGYINVFVLPAADFSVSATVVAVGEVVAFTSLSSGGIPPLTYTWDFDDDGVIDSTSQNPSYTYRATGTYTVLLKVTDARGNSTVERRAGYISVSNAIAPHTILPEGGTIQTADGQVTVTFPVGAISEVATLSINGLSPSAVAKAPGGYKMGNTCFSIEAVNAGGKTVFMSSQWVTVTVKYSDEDVAAAGGNPENLVLARYDDATGKWTVFDTTLIKADRSLSADTTHFSDWAVLAKKPSAGMAAWIWIIIGVVAGLVVAALVVRAVAVERMGGAPVTPA